MIPIPPLRKIDNSFADKFSSLGPNDHMWTNIGLNLATLLKSAVGEYPNSLLNLNAIQTMSATAVPSASNLNGVSNMQNVPQNQATEKVVSDHVEGSLNTAIVKINPNNRDENRNDDIASSISQEYKISESKGSPVDEKLWNKKK